MKIKSFAAVILTLILCLSFMSGCAGKSSEGNAVDETSAQAVQSTGITTTGTDNTKQPAEMFNILLIGVDNFIDQGTSDAILMLSVDEEHEKIKITSFNRDTYVHISGFGEANLNRAFVLGGTELLVKTVEDNFGVDIHRYALANYFSFEDMVNAVGGIDMTLTDEEILYINTLMKIEKKDKEITQSAGVVTLDGEQILCHMRNRGGVIGGKNFSGNEIDRAGRQRAFIEALIKSIESCTPDQLLSLAKAVVPMLNTDLTQEELNRLLTNFKIYLGYETDTMAMPSEGTFDIAGGEKDPRIIVNDWSKTRADISDFLEN